ncbi:lecithin retinol acyltransferase family protein [Achromobacter xylosoxidans]
MKSETIRAGDHLWIRCIGYAHHGIASSPNSVVHYRGKCGTYEDGIIAETSLYEFTNGATLHKKEHPNRRHTRAQSVARALERIGEAEYNLVFNNCEHFVTWCIDDEHTSEQVNDRVRMAGHAATASLLYSSYRKWAAAQRADTVYRAASLFTSRTATALVSASAASGKTAATLTGIASSASAGGLAGGLIAGGTATVVGVAAAPVTATIAIGAAVGTLAYAGWKALFDD